VTLFGGGGRRLGRSLPSSDYPRKAEGSQSGEPKKGENWVGNCAKTKTAGNIKEEESVMVGRVSFLKADPKGSTTRGNQK